MYLNMLICKIIAKIFGGGGHKKGAGFTVMDKKEDEIVSDIKAFLKLNGF